MCERMMLEADRRSGEDGGGVCPDDGRRLLRAWLDALSLEPGADALIARMQSEEFSHSDLARRARRVHERRLAAAVESAVASAGDIDRVGAVGLELFEACLPIIPYVPAQAFLAREQAKLSARERDPIRVALVADGVGSMHGVTHTLDEVRERGLPGFEVEVLGTDPNVDRRLSAVAEVDVPFYPGLQIGVPSLPTIAEALTAGGYDLVHLVSPGPAGIGAAVMARLLGLPVVGSYHTELAAYARLRTADDRIEAAVRMALAAFYGQCGRVLSPSAAADASLAELGIEPERIGRWDRGVDLDRFSPTLRSRAADERELVVLYAGRLTREKGADLLADAFLRARARDPRLVLALAGGGPEEETLRARLGDAARFLGWLDGDALAQAYANADMFLFGSETDTFGQVILEAQASGLPVVAVDAGGPRELIAHGRSGWLCDAEPDALAGAVGELADRPALRTRLSHGGLDAVRHRSWTAALQQLADGYRGALGAVTAARSAA